MQVACLSMTDKQFLARFSKRLQDYRKSSNLTQQQAATKFDVPVQTLRNWEYQLYMPNAFNYVKVVTEIGDQELNFFTLKK